MEVLGAYRHEKGVASYGAAGIGDYSFYPSHEQKSLGPHQEQMLRSHPAWCVTGALESPRPVIDK